MKYNLIFIIISIIILFIIINFYLYKYNKEYFSTSTPVGWCLHDGKMGLRLYNGFKYECVSMEDNSAKHVKSNKQFKYPKQSSNNDNTSSTSSTRGYGTTGYQSKNTDVQSAIQSSTTAGTTESKCIPIDSDYGKICQSLYGNSYGVQSIDSSGCEAGEVKIKCGKLYFNEIDYNKVGLYSTKCINNSFDMDTMCNEYMPDEVRKISSKSGYYDTSAGSQTVLKGKYGDCYNNDGSPNLSKSRAICNLKSNKEIQRILPFSYESDYNKFTDCHNMENYNFVQDCQNILSESNSEDELNVFADIHGFDCMPGYARAKCINKNDSIPVPYDLTKLKVQSKGNIYPFSKNN